MFRAGEMVEVLEGPFSEEGQRVFIAEVFEREREVTLSGQGNARFVFDVIRKLPSEAT
jgi:transcription antitermination factor NusG